MKKVVLAMILLISWVKAQDQDQLIQEFLQMRKQMLDRVFRDFDRMDPFDDPFFKDDFFRKRFRSQGRRHRRQLGPFAHSWIEGQDKKVLVIVPRDQKTQVNIEMDPKKGQIVLTHEEKIERRDGSGQTVEDSSSQSKTFLSYPVEVNREKTQIHQVEGKIVVCFPNTEGGNCEDQKQLKSLVAQNMRPESQRRVRPTRKQRKKRQYFRSLRPGEGDINL